jgi:hypothetical protein
LLLGYLIDKISGEKYPQFLKENIFTPLGMADSGYDLNSSLIVHRAAGYTATKTGEIQNTGYIDMTIPYSAGALYSTTRDLLKWERGLFGGNVLKAESLKKMITPFKENYGFGLFISSVDGHKKIDHEGGIEGFNTYVGYYPDDQLTIVVLANLNGGAPGDIARKAAAVEFGGSVKLTSERKEITLKPEELGALVGTYALGPGVDLAITLEGGQLSTQLTGQPKFPIFAESSTFFFLKVVDAQLEFEKDGSGKAMQVTLHQNGQNMVAKKK